MADYAPDDGPLTTGQIEIIRNDVKQDRHFKATKELFSRNEGLDKGDGRPCREEAKE
jgi:hypothetical protein